MKNYIISLMLITILAISGCSGARKADVPMQLMATADTKEVVKDTDYQMTMPEKGDIIVILHVKDFGDIKIKLFPEDSPKAVDNFVGLAKKGYYNGVIFHRVIEDFMIQGGDPGGTGAGGESLFGGEFENEYSDTLYPVRGALCMARKQALDTNQSQFFIVQAGTVVQNDLDDLVETGAALPVFAQEKFLTYGGAPHLVDYHHTIFGQVYEGIEVVDKIAAVETKDVGVYDRPVENVVIESIEVLEYE